jgi:hypothetical protein
MKAGSFLAGRPEDIIEALKAVERRYPGLDRVICATPLGTPLEVQLADLDRFAGGDPRLPQCQDRRGRRIERSRSLTRSGPAFRKGWEWCDATLATSAFAPAAAAARA